MKNRRAFYTFVTPAQARVQAFEQILWIPASAGMTEKSATQMLQELLSKKPLGFPRGFLL
jgi:hypothetical protein